MQMFYAERIDEKTSAIAERGIFFDIAEFAPYRALGWSGTREINALADAYLLALGEAA